MDSEDIPQRETDHHNRVGETTDVTSHIVHDDHEIPICHCAQDLFRASSRQSLRYRATGISPSPGADAGYIHPTLSLHTMAIAAWNTLPKNLSRASQNSLHPCSRTARPATEFWPSPDRSRKRRRKSQIALQSRAAHSHRTKELGGAPRPA